ncbi:hypothetical protein VTO42DRAFT_4437 [Malbranchea cinnamomea]
MLLRSELVITKDPCLQGLLRLQTSRDYRETTESTFLAPSEEMEPEAYEAKQFFTRSYIVELLEAIKTIASRQATPATDDKSERERELNSYCKDLKTRLEIKLLL